MNYQPREGIVLVRVCDTFLLVPTRKVSEECPGIATLSPFDAILWRRMEKGDSYEDLLDLFAKFTMQPREKIVARLDQLLQKLYDKGFLVAVV